MSEIGERFKEYVKKKNAGEVEAEKFINPKQKVTKENIKSPVKKTSKKKQFLRGKTVYRKILKKSKPMTVVLKERKEEPYRSRYFNEVMEKEMENLFFK